MVSGSRRHESRYSSHDFFQRSDPRYTRRSGRMASCRSDYDRSQMAMEAADEAEREVIRWVLAEELSDRRYCGMAMIEKSGSVSESSPVSDSVGLLTTTAMWT